MGRLPLPPGAKGHHSEVSGRPDDLRIEADFRGRPGAATTRQTRPVKQPRRRPNGQTVKRNVNKDGRRSRERDRGSDGRPKSKFTKNKKDDIVPRGKNRAAPAAISAQSKPHEAASTRP